MFATQSRRVLRWTLWVSRHLCGRLQYCKRRSARRTVPRRRRRAVTPRRGTPIGSSGSSSGVFATACSAGSRCSTTSPRELYTAASKFTNDPASPPARVGLYLTPTPRRHSAQGHTSDRFFRELVWSLRQRRARHHPGRPGPSSCSPSPRCSSLRRGERAGLVEAWGLSARWPGHATVSERRKTMPKKPGRPVTNRIMNTIPATGEEIAAAICVAADGTIRQSLEQGQPSVRPSAASTATAFRPGPGRGNICVIVSSFRTFFRPANCHVAVQVLRAQLVERAHVGPLEHRRDSIPLVWACPRTYSPTLCRTA